MVDPPQAPKFAGWRIEDSGIGGSYLHPFPFHFIDES